MRVPDGFVLTADAFRLHLREASLTEWIDRTLAGLDARDVRAAGRGRARRFGRGCGKPRSLRPWFPRSTAAYAELSRRYGETATDVAVRSSATAEDLPGASFAGQHETYLNVRGTGRPGRRHPGLLRLAVYRPGHRLSHASTASPTARWRCRSGVQKMVRSDLGSAGVIFTLDTESGFRDVVLITGAWGIAESLVQGRVAPDEFWMHKPTLRAGFRSILRRERGTKAVKLVYAEGGLRAVREVRVPEADRRRFVLTDDELLTLARWALAIEEHYSGGRRAAHARWTSSGRVMARAASCSSCRPGRRPCTPARSGARLELFRRQGSGPRPAHRQERGTAGGHRSGTPGARTRRSCPWFRPARCWWRG